MWGDRGFPLIDAVITLQDNRLRIRAPGFLAPPAMEYEADLVAIADMTPVGGGEELAGARQSYVRANAAGA